MVLFATEQVKNITNYLTPISKINNITITCDNGKYYAILNIETKIEQWPITNQTKDYDLNSNKNHFLVSNTGEKYQFNVNRENQMIKKLNISLSTKKKGSRAFKKIQKKTTQMV